MRQIANGSIFNPDDVPKKSDFIDRKGKFSVGLTYQNQFFPLLNGKDKAIGENEMKKDCPGFIVSIRGMEIVHKRNKVDEPCNNDGEEDYIKELEDLTASLGCKAFPLFNELLFWGVRVSLFLMNYDSGL